MDCSQSPPLIALTSPPLGWYHDRDATHQSVDLQVADGQAERCGCW